MIGSGSINLPANGHTSFILTDSQSGYPVTANRLGTVEFETPEGSQISAAEIHVTAQGAFSSIPVLAKTVATPTATLTTTNVIANDLAWDAADNQIYLSLPSSDGTNGNTVQVLDPSTGDLGASAFAGSEPNLLSVSATGKYLYVGLSGASIVQRMTLPDLGTDIQIALGGDSFFGPYYAADLQASPTADGTVAVVRNVAGTSPAEEGGVVIYDDGVARPSALCGFSQTGCTTNNIGDLFDSIQWNADGSMMFASDEEDSGGDFYVIPVTANGFGTPTGDQGDLGGSEIHFDATTGYVYGDNGSVVDPVAGTKVGSFGASGLMVPDGSLGVAFFIGQSIFDSGSTTYTLQSFDIHKFTPISTLTIENVVGAPTHLIRWGTNGLAFTTNTPAYSSTTGGAVYVLSGAFVNPNGVQVTPQVSTGNVQRTWGRRQVLRRLANPAPEIQKIPQ